MSKIAFPFNERNDDGTIYRQHMGMTLRDYFAAHALSVIGGRGWDHVGDDKAIIQRWAATAYLVADVMLAAREVQP